MMLLESMELAGIPLRNRLIVAPMSRMQANEDGCVSLDMPAYYANYARNGAGLVITEAIYVDHQSGRAYFNQPGLVDEAQRESWRDVVKAVHAADGKIFAQLQHGGRLAEPGLNRLHLAASDGAAAGLSWQTGRPNIRARAVSTAEIHRIAASFEQAAIRAREAGFDGIEIHGARGYLLDDFLSASTNRRNDEYGGSLENRLRFSLDVVRRVRRAVDGIPISYNMSLYKMDDIAYQPPGGKEEIRRIVQSLEDAGVDLLHVSTRKALRAEAWGETLVRTVADALTHAQLIANGGLTTLEECENVLSREGASAVSLARAMLANPDWLLLSTQGGPIQKYSPGMEREPLKTI